MSELRNAFTIRYYAYGRDVMTENAETFASALQGGKVWLDLGTTGDSFGFEVTMTGRPRSEFAYSATKANA